MEIERFKELLNLYLDDEISSADLSDLISETRRDAERQKIFLEYCRIHKACKLLRNELNAEPAPRRSVRQTIYALGGLAAAFALLAMAGRNIVPLLDSGQDMVVNQPSEEAMERLSEFAATEVFAVIGGPRVNRLIIEPVGFSKGGRIDLSQALSMDTQLRLSGQQDEFRNAIEKLLRDASGRVSKPGFEEMLIDEGIMFDPAVGTDLSQDLQTISHRLEIQGVQNSPLPRD